MLVPADILGVVSEKWSGKFTAKRYIPLSHKKRCMYFLALLSAFHVLLQEFGTRGSMCLFLVYHLRYRAYGFATKIEPHEQGSCRRNGTAPLLIASSNLWFTSSHFWLYSL